MITVTFQANALGASLSSTQLTHIYASPLLRAYSTAEYVQYHQNYPMPSIKTNPHLREQYYGIAEGHPWVAQPPDSDVPLELLYEKAIFPVLHDRDAKFPESESLNDLASRAEKGIRECVLPHLQESQFPEVAHSDIHIAIASHGRCIGELLSALLRLDPEAERDLKFTKLANTAWTRMYVRIRDGHHGLVDPTNPPPLQVVITNVNEQRHLQSLVRLHDIARTFDLNGAGAKVQAYFGGERSITDDYAHSNGGGRVMALTNPPSWIMFTRNLY
ncbi:hypothetical protein CVT25_011491 [Psilocybe cyanescens]|uniref:Phosphoglycerate mutase n=1 Tax=Psilocybe cyanescens TaxID=93625 RepID=A0A409XA12_PSICY|nr:hypothetical protein CVT25_011491 [Psilocybe cyanescens]